MHLLSKFNNMKGIEAPTNDCLAIARDFYCFNAFRRCRDSEMVRTSEISNKICEFRQKLRFATIHALYGLKDADSQTNQSAKTNRKKNGAQVHYISRHLVSA